MKIEVWPSRMGATVTSGRLMIEVWEHGGARRCVPDKTMCGFSGTHFTRVAKGDIESMCKAAVELWNRSQHAWQPCE